MSGCSWSIHEFSGLPLHSLSLGTCVVSAGLLSISSSAHALQTASIEPASLTIAPSASGKLPLATRHACSVRPRTSNEGKVSMKGGDSDYS